MISIVLPVYNSAATIRECLDSILTQSYREFELIIINDGSTDDSMCIIQQYDDVRIHLLVNERNMGLIYTLNRGLEAVKGEYIVRMDADDIMCPNRLELQKKYMDAHEDIVASGTQINSFSNSKKNIKQRVLPCSPDLLGAYLYLATPINHPTAIIRTQVVKDNHIRYNESFKHAEDYKFWVDLAQFGKLANLPEKLLNYRLSESQISIKYNVEQLHKTKVIRCQLIERYLQDWAISSKLYDSDFLYKYSCKLALEKNNRTKLILDNIQLVFILTALKNNPSLILKYLFGFGIFKLRMPVKYVFIIILSCLSKHWDFYTLE